MLHCIMNKLQGNRARSLTCKTFKANLKPICLNPLNVKCLTLNPVPCWICVDVITAAYFDGAAAITITILRDIANLTVAGITITIILATDLDS